MFSAERIYSLDIETDNSEGFGLDPRKSRITEISVLTETGGEVFTDRSEKQLLLDTARYVVSLPPGLICTWNGSFFDFPFIDTRREVHSLLERWMGPALSYDPGLKPKYEPTPGHQGGYIAVWSSAQTNLPHQHLDISGAYKQFAADAEVPWSLKPVCKAAGIEMVELDRTRLHEYTDAERRAYVLSDTIGTRELTLSLLGLA